MTQDTRNKKTYEVYFTPQGQQVQEVQEVKQVRQVKKNKKLTNDQIQLRVFGFVVIPFSIFTAFAIHPLAFGVSFICGVYLISQIGVKKNRGNYHKRYYYTRRDY